jgi:hypothetical protein
MSISSITISSSSQVKYDTQGVEFATTSAYLSPKIFISKSSISSLTSSFSSINIVFRHDMSNFTINTNSSYNYLLSNIYNNLSGISAAQSSLPTSVPSAHQDNYNSDNDSDYNSDSDID